MRARYNRKGPAAGRKSQRTKKPDSRMAARLHPGACGTERLEGGTCGSMKETNVKLPWFSGRRRTNGDPLTGHGNSRTSSAITLTIEFTRKTYVPHVQWGENTPLHAP